MKTYLLRFSVNGIKNINNNISIDYYKKSIRKNSKISLENRNVKGIFGINGAGKTAYIYGVYLYQLINTKSNYLLQEKIKNTLLKIINKKKKEISLESIFAVSHDEVIINDIFKHSLLIKEETNDIGEPIFVVEEKLSKQIGSNIDGEYKLIYKVKDGKLTTSDKDSKMILDYLSNKLLQSTVVSYGYSIFNKFDKELKSELFDQILYLTIFNYSLSVYIDNEDDYSNYLFYKPNIKGKENSKYYKLLNDTLIRINQDEDILEKSALTDYKKVINQLKKFIQIIKPDLLDIRLDERYDGKYYHVRKIFVYKYGEVDELYESSGIKRIIKLFSFLQAAMTDKIVFFDEFDANISGVFLDKLIEYITDNSKGQLIFTTHDILSMNILKKYKDSIVTIGESGKVVPIVKNGNYSPVNQFYEGMIEDSPFNINSFDFLKVFSEDN